MIDAKADGPCKYPRDVLEAATQEYLSPINMYPRLGVDDYLDESDRKRIMNGNRLEDLLYDIDYAQGMHEANALGHIMHYCKGHEKFGELYAELEHRLEIAGIGVPEDYQGIGLVTIGVLNDAVKHIESLLSDKRPKPHENIVARLFCNNPERVYYVTLLDNLGERNSGSYLGDEATALDVYRLLQDTAPWLPVSFEEVRELILAGPKKYWEHTTLDIMWRQRPENFWKHPEQGVEFNKVILVLRDHVTQEASKVVVHRPVKVHLRLPYLYEADCKDKNSGLPKYVVNEDYDQLYGGELKFFPGDPEFTDDLLAELSSAAPRRIFELSFPRADIAWDVEYKTLASMKDKNDFAKETSKAYLDAIFKDSPFGGVSSKGSDSKRKSRSKGGVLSRLFSR